MSRDTARIVKAIDEGTFETTDSIETNAQKVILEIGQKLQNVYGVAKTIEQTTEQQAEQQKKDAQKQDDEEPIAHSIREVLSRNFGDALKGVEFINRDHPLVKMGGWISGTISESVSVLKHNLAVAKAQKAIEERTLEEQQKERENLSKASQASLTVPLGLDTKGASDIEVAREEAQLVEKQTAVFQEMRANTVETLRTSNELLAVSKEQKDAMVKMKDIQANSNGGLLDELSSLLLPMGTALTSLSKVLGSFKNFAGGFAKSVSNLLGGGKSAITNGAKDGIKVASEKGSDLLKGGAKVAKAGLKRIPIVGTVAGGILAVNQAHTDMSEIDSQLESGQITEDQAKVMKENTVKQAGGAMTGTVVGGAIGATIGSVVPIIGTTIGGAIGAMAGEAIGSYFGGEMANEVPEAKKQESETTDEKHPSKYKIFKSGNIEYRVDMSDDVKDLPVLARTSVRRKVTKEDGSIVDLGYQDLKDIDNDKLRNFHANTADAVIKHGVRLQAIGMRNMGIDNSKFLEENADFLRVNSNVEFRKWFDEQAKAKINVNPTAQQTNALNQYTASMEIQRRLYGREFETPQNNTQVNQINNNQTTVNQKPLTSRNQDSSYQKMNVERWMFEM